MTCTCVGATDTHWEGCPDSWEDEVAIRASGEMLCGICGRPYWRHPQPAKLEAPTLVRACDGRLLKL